MNSSLTVQIARAIADAEGVEPSDLEYTLHEYVDTEAISALFASTNTRCTVQFEVPNHTVTASNDDTISIDGTRVQLP